MSGPSSAQQAEEDRLAQLMVAYQNGDLSAFEQLYEALVVDVRRYLARMHRDRAMIHDLVQDTFLEVHRSRRTYLPPLPVRPWIFGIARNVAARGRRADSLQPRGTVALDAPELQLTVPSNSSSTLDAQDIEDALAGLPAATREPWLLHHLAGLSFQVIAARLGITTMAAKLRSSRATKALRHALRLKGVGER
jgi:RNA polymerase sigma factor (sigma-70 family)